MNRLSLVCAACSVWPLFAAGADAPNLAQGRRVEFAPAPNYRLTRRGDTDAADLTDGNLTRRKDDRLWFDRTCVGWSYPGLAQLVVDLGAPRPVGEIAIRFQGGSPQAGVCMPGWVDAAASLDGKTFYKAASYCRWRPGDKERFHIRPNDGNAWVFELRFPRVNVRARYVGLSFYGTGLTVADELYVRPCAADQARPPAGDPLPFAARGAAAYFHKPKLYVTTNIATPTPVGLIVSRNQEKAPLEVVLELPEGMSLRAGGFGKRQAGDPQRTTRAGAERVVFKLKPGKSNKAAGRVYFSAAWKPGRRGVIRYQTRWPGGATPVCSIPVEAIRIPACPVRSKRLMLGLGWWSLGATMKWPNALRAFETIGFNTVPLFAYWTHFDAPEVKEFLTTCRRRGFKIVNIDSPWHRMLTRYKKDKEIYCQFADGSVGKKLCPSYRGPHYREEIERLAKQTAAARASYLSCDIELWGWRGPTDAAKCMRCQKDFKASGCKDIAEWKLRKGYEIWRDMAEAVRREMTKAGLPMPDMGGYDFEAGKNYQFFWPFDRLYPEYMQSAQVSTYTPLEPYHIALVGDEVRRNRSRLPKSDVLPWITPGDAGTFPGWAFRAALLECFCNGARGVYFWSGRVWDAESLAAFAQVIREIAPVEDVIVDGELLAGVTTHPAVRVSGMRAGDRMVILAADYFAKAAKTVQITVPVRKRSVVIDLEIGRRLAVIEPGRATFAAPLAAHAPRLLLVQPE